MTRKHHILLVHGAWGDASHWQHVIPLLHKAGFKISAVQNPLSSLPDDVKRTQRLAEEIAEPVILVGHSYGGMVISGAGHAENVVGLVYVAAFAPDEGETPADLFKLRAPPPGAQYLKPDKSDYLWIDQDHFHESFCQDLDATEALVMSITQKPIAMQCFADKAGKPAWKDKPSWYQISTQDRMIPPETEQWFAQRIGARTVISLDSSHASLASHPKEIADFIITASEAL
ncbi:alpha/beta hydrolase [Pseudomonas sp. 25 R 14]|uniref:alpha/beta hydrolase n=1 Tax=Pseudomonas sp. 25 R 14 TaxID=1844109 RepID=UPI00081254F9|nr:alpha/beta hydrolase [Pseudomonas sp. 25 R 14]CRM75765.1 putative esterase of the alpha/beta hydrolase fold protein [Pseudomonas sp. 25 R 14]